jgi:hypothetical protein
MAAGDHAASRWRCLALLLCLFALPARARDCPIVDATAEVWPLAAQTSALPPAEQVAQFRRRIVARFPGLYAETVLGLADVQVMDERILRALASARAPEAPGRRIAAVLVRDLPGYEQHFRRSFPDLRCDFPIYLTLTLGQLDGAGRLVDGRPALVFGVDTIAQLHSAEQLPVFVSHELFHRYHFQVAGFSDDPGDGQAIWRTLWAEGLATYVSARLNPDRPLSDAFMLPPDLAERAAPLTPRLAQELEDDETPDPALYAKYFTYRSPAAEAAGLPSRAGYYIGYRVAALAARGRTLQALAHRRGPALQAEIQRDLQSLAQPSIRRARAGAK